MVEIDQIHYLNAIAQVIFDKKGSNILALDVRSISTLTDYVIIAEGTVDKHVKAIADAIVAHLAEMGQRPVFVEGLRTGGWIVLDYMHIMVHLFIPEMREKYQLEKLWKEAKIVDVHINVGNIN